MSKPTFASNLAPAPGLANLANDTEQLDRDLEKGNSDKNEDKLEKAEGKYEDELEKAKEKYEDDLEKAEEKYEDDLEKLDKYLEKGDSDKYEEKREKLEEKYGEKRESLEEKYEEKLEQLKEKYDIPDGQNPESFTSSPGTTEQQNFVTEALNKHAQQLGETFAEDSDWQAFLTDIYGTNIDSNIDLVALRDAFVSGDLRPQVRFVPQEALTDPRGQTRDVAFAIDRQILLLSEDLDKAGIEQAILDDIGHWWDGQLSNQDTVDADGEPFDEGVAYAERFAEGVEGNDSYSDEAFLNDRFTISLDGESTDVEFQPNGDPEYSDATATYLDSIFPDDNGQGGSLTLQQDSNGNNFFTTKEEAETAIDTLVEGNNFVFANIIDNNGQTAYQVGFTNLGQGQHPAWGTGSLLKDHLKTYAKELIGDGRTPIQTSEAAGEIATAIAVVNTYDNATLKSFKGSNSQNIDQIWEDETGGNSTLIIAEAKGGGSRLSRGISEFDGQIIDNQMSPEWVIDRLGKKDLTSPTESELIQKYGISKKAVDTSNKPLYVINGFNNSDNQTIAGLVIQAQSQPQSGANAFYTNQTSTIPNSNLAGNGSINYTPLLQGNLPANPAQVNINDSAISEVFAKWQETPEFRSLIEEITKNGEITIRTTSGFTLNGTPKPAAGDFSDGVTAFWSPSDRTINLNVNTTAPTKEGFQNGLSNLLFELHNAKYDAEYQNLYNLAVGVTRPGFADAKAFASAVNKVETDAAADWAALAVGNPPLLTPVQPSRFKSFNVDATLPDLFTDPAVKQASINFYEKWFNENQDNRNALRFDVNKPDTETLLAEFGGDGGGITDGGNEKVRSNFFTFQDITQGTDVRELNPASDIDPNLPTYILTHGFTDGVNSGAEWQKKMGSAILQQQDANIILVDWNAPGFAPNVSLENATLVSLTDYEQSAKNTEVIGDRIAKLVRDTNINPANTTLIGHSLGAQVSGWAGQKFQELQPGAKISNIVGLDPARPGFQESLNSEFYLDLLPANIFGSRPLGDYVSSHQLNADDANRVTAIHTSQRFGITNPITGAEGTENPNTLDIYINGGSYFSGISGFADPIGNRSHNYSHEFFQYLLEGEGFNQDRNDVTDSQPLSNLKNPLGDAEFPLVSLNTILQGNGTPEDINQGIVDITVSGSERSAQVAQIPDNLLFEATDVNDTLAGTKKSDLVVGKGGNDILSGLQGNDEMSGDGGNDLLFGGEGIDTLFGDDDLGTGNNLLIGGQEDDLLFAGKGGDTLIGIDSRAGIAGVGEVDILNGGEGNDTFILGDERGDFYGDGDSQVSIENFVVGQDRLQVNNAFALSLTNFTTVEPGQPSREGVQISNKSSGAITAFVFGVTSVEQLESSLIETNPLPVPTDPGDA